MANEIDKLDPVPGHVILKSGLRVELEALKARQFFKLLRILTHGALPGMREAGLFEMRDMEGEEFVGRLLSITLLSIPDAEEETLEFLRSLCYPAGLIERKGLNKQDIERNKILWEGLDEELENPELDDVVTIMEAVIRREAADIQALGKRLSSLFSLAEKTGQLNESPNSKESNRASSAGSRARSTRSPRATAGRTKQSKNSPSDDSGSASLSSPKDSTALVGSASNG